jgi:hypothetical protein
MDEMKTKIGLLEQLIKLMSAEEVKGLKAEKEKSAAPAVVAVEVTEEPVPADPKDAIVEELFNKKPAEECVDEEDDEDEEDY